MFCSNIVRWNEMTLKKILEQFTSDGLHCMSVIGVRSIYILPTYDSHLDILDANVFNICSWKSNKRSNQIIENIYPRNSTKKKSFLLVIERQIKCEKVTFILMEAWAETCILCAKQGNADTLLHFYSHKQAWFTVIDYRNCLVPWYHAAELIC